MTQAAIRHEPRPEEAPGSRLPPRARPTSFLPAMPDPLRLTPSPGEQLIGAAGRLLTHVPGSWLLRLMREPARTGDAGTLDPHVQFLLRVQRLRGRRGLVEPSVPEGRARLERDIRGSTGTPTPVGTVRDLTVPGAIGPLPARVYAPAPRDDGPLPLLVFLHGGGFVIGSLETHDEPCRVLCERSRMIVLSVAYRLAPEHPYPAGLDDCVAVARWAIAQAAALGTDPRCVTVGGDSAGGNLAVLTALTLARSGTRLAGQLLIYPVTEVEGRHPSRQLHGRGLALTNEDIAAFMDLYVPDSAARTGEHADFVRAADLGVLPPTYLVTAGFDPLRDEGRALGSALQSAGVSTRTREFGSLIHGFLHLTPVVPAARDALNVVADEWGALVRASVARVS